MTFQSLISLVLNRTIVCGVFFATIIAGFAGCSNLQKPIPRTPDSDERAIFEAMTQYYCEHRGWPRKWDDFAQAPSLSTETLDVIGEFVGPEVSSPRAILLVLRYRNIQGIDRKVTFIAPPDCGEDGDDDEVSIAGGRVKFSLPSRFTALSGEAIKTKWRGGPYPDAAWHEEKEGIFLTVTFGEVVVSPSGLGALKEELEGAYEGSVPTLEWIEKGLSDRVKPPRLVHEFISDGPKDRLVSYNVTTSFDGKLLTFSIAGPATSRARVEAVADSLHSSLVVK